MPALRPKRRASYEHEAITPVPTMTGRPRSRGSRRCSIAGEEGVDVHVEEDGFVCRHHPSSVTESSHHTRSADWSWSW